MSDENEIIEILKEAFADNSIGLSGHRNNNGADWLYCPGCGSRKDVMGYIDSTGHITEISHSPDCQLMRLYDMTKEKE